MEKNKNLKEVSIKIEGKEWEEALDKAFKKINATKTIDGFRKGKAPKNIFLKKTINFIKIPSKNLPRTLRQIMLPKRVPKRQYILT